MSILQVNTTSGLLAIITWEKWKYWFQKNGTFFVNDVFLFCLKYLESMCKSAASSCLITLFSIVGTCFMAFLYVVYKTNPTFYDNLENPDVTCKGLWQTALAYLVTALVSGTFWIYYIYKDKHTVVVEASVFDENKKRFHFASTKNEETTSTPLLKAQY